jgi:lipopolysaccharide/colanic/teichoic acid biosynthesis glycosyltransferase/ADP-glucose pyrophosphorylase
LNLPRTAVILGNAPAVLDEVSLGDFPKLLLPLANRPLVEYQLSLLASVGVTELLICTGREFEDRVPGLDLFAESTLNIQWHFQDVSRGTAGTLKEIEGRLEGTFWVMGGGLLLDADLTPMVEAHFRSGTLATVAAVREEDPAWRMERIETDGAGRIRTIQRIHPAHSRRSKLRPLDLYLFDRRVLASIPDHGYFDIKEQLLLELFGQAQQAIVHEFAESARTISSLDNLLSANADILLKRSPFLPFLQGGAATAAEGKEFSRPLSVIELPPVLVGRSSSIGERAALVGPLSIGEGCSVGQGAILNSSIVLDGAVIGPGARLTNCIIGPGVTVESGAELREVAVTADRNSRHGGVVSAAFRAEPAAIRADSCEAALEAGSRRRSYELWKQTFDFAFSFVCLILLAPVMLAIALAVRLDSGGPVVFRQRRCGKDGVEFTMYKFRTMVADAEEIKRELRTMNEVDGPMFKIADDPRVTRVGRVLRSANLDELPQFWNILRGDMALVGPRPLSWEEMRYNPRWRDMRIILKPGLVGLWQVRSHCKPHFADWIQADTEYVRNRSAWMDFKIFLTAVKTVGRSVFNAFSRSAKERQFDCN